MQFDRKRALLLPLVLSALAPAVDAGAAGRAAADLGFGPFTVVAELGTGGMGTVYLAEQREPVVRCVALKVMREGFDSPAARRQFDRERRALAAANHDHVARYLEGGETADGRPWFAMEHVVGEPLLQYCDRRGLSLAARIELFEQLCRGVQHLHDLGVQHRDIKSDNVIVTESGGRPAVKLIDLGLALLSGPLAEHENAGARRGRAAAGSGLGATSGAATPHAREEVDVDPVGGTLTHMAPEQFYLPERDLDPRADVHALGVLLYELLVGAVPQVPRGATSGVSTDDGASAWTLTRTAPAPSERLHHGDLDVAAVAAARALRPAALRRLLRGGLDRIAQRAVAVDRERRHPSASSLASDLRGEVDRWARRRTALRNAVVAGVGGLVGALVALL